VKKLPKWVWDELDKCGQDILSVKEDGKLPVRIMVEPKLEELLGKSLAEIEIGEPIE
jgi:hypothetical protein